MQNFFTGLGFLYHIISKIYSVNLSKVSSFLKVDNNSGISIRMGLFRFFLKGVLLCPRNFVEQGCECDSSGFLRIFVADFRIFVIKFKIYHDICSQNILLIFRVF